MKAVTETIACIPHKRQAVMVFEESYLCPECVGDAFVKAYQREKAIKMELKKANENIDLLQARLQNSEERGGTK